MRSSPSISLAIVLLASATALAAESPLARAGRLLKLEKEARSLAARGEPEEALERLDALLAERPRRVSAVALKARILRKASRYLDVIELVDALPDSVRRDLRVLGEKVRAVLETAGPEAALASLDESRIGMAWQAETWLLRAELHARSRDAEQTMLALRRAVHSGFVDPETITANPVFSFLPRGGEIEKILELARRGQDYLALPATDRGGKLPPEARSAYSLKELRTWLRYTRRRGHPITTVAHLSRLDGEVFSTGALEGKALIVLAWAHWSTKSQAMVREVARLQAKAETKGVEVRLAAVDLFDQGTNFATRTDEWLEAAGVSLPCSVVSRTRARKLLGVAAVPITFFFARDGGLYLYAPSVIPPGDLDTLVDDLLAPLPDPEPGRSADEPPATGAQEGDTPVTGASKAPEAP